MAEPNEQQPGAMIQSLVVRKSAIFLGVQLISVELFFLLAISVVQLVLASNATITTGSLDYSGFAVAITLLLLVIKLGITFWFIAAWLNDFYEIHPAEIICHHGIVAQHISVLSTKEVKSMTVDQDFFGRLFRYGDIELSNPTLDEAIRLTNIHNPNRQMAVIGQLIPQLEQSTIFMRPHHLQSS